MSNQSEPQPKFQNEATKFYKQTFDNNFKKKINFDPIVFAVLIPSIKDMDNELQSQLWWNNIDYDAFYNSANNEISKFLKIHSELTRKDAVRLLYDHSIICYEPYIISDNEVKRVK